MDVAKPTALKSQLPTRKRSFSDMKGCPSGLKRTNGTKKENQRRDDRKQNSRETPRTTGKRRKVGNEGDGDEGNEGGKRNQKDGVELGSGLIESGSDSDSRTKIRKLCLAHTGKRKLIEEKTSAQLGAAVSSG